MLISTHNTLACIYAVTIIISLASCKKLVEIDPPANSITTSQVFDDSADAAAAIAGIYSKMNNTGPFTPGFGNGRITMVCGLYADELAPFGAAPDRVFYTNIVSAGYSTIKLYLWDQPYSYIYQANACIEGLQKSKGISTGAKNQFIGEAKFLRALNYFYLVNLFDDVPLVLTTDWETSAKTSRTAKQAIYQNLVSDLKDAQRLLLPDYSYSANERTRANKWAATALLARVYLYTDQWAFAEAEANAIINATDIFNLPQDINEVFLKNSNEAILQWNLNTAVSPFNITVEGYNMLPATNGRPTYYLGTQLLNAFEAGDNRKAAWIKPGTFQGNNYEFANKYKKGPGDGVPNDEAGEYYMVLRLGEQVLIRAEARARQDKLEEAADDINVIRARAGLVDLPASVNQNQLLTAILQERKTELFAEWGHRWLDLKRTGNADAVMNVVTPLKAGQAWSSFRKLLPIPLSELQKNPFMQQNQGY